MQELCQITDWFIKNQRDFPWRKVRTPYRVWVSEVMLQQTRASVVVEYFQRWMQTFPTIEALASAKEETVIKLWEGLGYYSRARNLHRGAQQVVKDYGGNIPSTYEDLLNIKGIGPYTAGAILSFAFGKKAAAIDGNVKRVLARYLGTEEKLDVKLIDILPDQGAPIAMEGLIELGATLCGKTPLCSLCPLAEGCVAKRDGLTLLLPSKKKRAQVTDLYRFVACIDCNGTFLLKKGEEGKVMADLWEFPYLPCDTDPTPSNLLRQLEQTLDLELTLALPLKREKHHFTRFRSHLFPYLIRATKAKPVTGYHWKAQLEELPFSSGHRKIVGQLFRER